ncbi:MAG: lytic transglycosylase domain-containing protein, partial [Bradyrhizobium sp.]|nr:lytic transglycosylase domain-containing protein [Bradyrhizobium sp.]
MTHTFRPLTCVLTLAVCAGLSSQGLARTPQKHGSHGKKAAPAHEARHGEAAAKQGKHADQVAARAKPSSEAAADSAKAPELTGDPALIKSAFDLIRQGKTSDATATAQTIGDPVAKILAEWFILRHSESEATFNRYAAFVADNPGWPGTGLMRRRAEARLWQEKSDPATVRRFIGDQPLTAKGRFALARVLLGEGDRDGAARLAREAWRSDELTERSEADAFDTFHDLFTREDHRARMDRRIGAKDFAGAMRAARRVGDDDVAIVKACAAVSGNDDKAADKLSDVAGDARRDLGFTLCRIQQMLRKDQIADALQLVQSAPRDGMALQDTDEWWRVRRILARKLLDAGDIKGVYQVTREAALPANKNYRAEFYFLPGWIALRYLNDPATAAERFAHIDDGSADPIVLARANYWRGRAAEAKGETEAMRNAYQAAAQHGTAYYGQLARARLGLDRIELRTPGEPQTTAHSAFADELAHAADILYTIGEREAVMCFVADLAENSTDEAALAAVAEVTGRHNDAHAMLELGKTALARGLGLDPYAFPTIGIPQHNPIGPAIDRSIIYGVARTESAFNQKDRSSANAVGLMQVTPEAGRDTAKRFRVEYDWDKMVSDPVYNTQMGAAELSALLSEYRGSQIMTFAGYNAGRGRVRDWVKSHGDPRDPNVDAIDWVERIPIAETRNYVQRVMENLQVYRKRFGDSAATIEPNLHRAAMVGGQAGRSLAPTVQLTPPNN